MKKYKQLLLIIKLSNRILPLYFIFLAAAAILPTEDIFTASTQATLLIVCFPLLILNNYFSIRLVRRDYLIQKRELYKRSLIMNLYIQYKGNKYIFEKVISAREKESDLLDEDSLISVEYQEGDTLVIRNYECNAKIVAIIQYKKVVT